MQEGFTVIAEENLVERSWKTVESRTSEESMKTEHWMPIVIPSDVDNKVPYRSLEGLDIEIRELWKAISELNRRTHELAEDER